MVGSINALSNMEYMLYGNTPGYGSINAPSMMNNYCMNLNNNYGFNPYMNQYMNPYYNTAGQYNPTFGQNITSAYTAQQTNSASNNVFAGLSTAEQNAIINDYAQSLSPSESFLGTTVGAVGFSTLFHPRAIFHPINTFKSFKETNKLFNLEGNLLEAWQSPGKNEILREAYAATNRIDARALKGRGFWHIRRNGFVNEKEYKDIRNIMEKAVNAYKKHPTEENLTKIIEATERLNRANVKDGILPKGINWVKNLVREDKVEIKSALENSKPVTQAAEDAGKKATGWLGRLIGNGATETTAAETAKAAMNGGKSYLQTLKTSGGGAFGAVLMLGFEFLGSKGKIKDSFEKDSKTGWKQLGQTTVKGLGSAAGWAAGEALGTWGTAKLFAKFGSKIKPGIGTAIGAIAGMVVGSIGCWLSGKVTKKLVGQDVGDKVQAEKLAKTNEGQMQLVQNTAARIQNGDDVDRQAQIAIQKLLAQYS